MSLRGVPDGQRQAFLDHLLSGSAAQQRLGPGIKACALHAGNRPGLALIIAREATQTGQLQRMLERRFEQALAFDGCFIFIDAYDAVVIWHALPVSRSAVEKTLSRMLALADLQALDTAPKR